MSQTNPMSLLLQAWRSAKSAGDLSARYCTLATLEQDECDQPRTRTLVARDITDKSCLLYVNRESQKNLKCLEEARLEILFFYPSLMAQFRLRGSLSLLPSDELKAHWTRKPYESKLLDHYYNTVHAQSTGISAKLELEEGVASLKRLHPDPESVPFAENAIGLVVTANYLEVWQGGENGIHDRRLFSLNENGWMQTALVP